MWLFFDLPIFLWSLFWKWSGLEDLCTLVFMSFFIINVKAEITLVSNRRNTAIIWFMSTWGKNACSHQNAVFKDAQPPRQILLIKDKGKWRIENGCAVQPQPCHLCSHTGTKKIREDCNPGDSLWVVCMQDFIFTFPCFLNFPVYILHIYLYNIHIKHRVCIIYTYNLTQWPGRCSQSCPYNMRVYHTYI